MKIGEELQKAHRSPRLIWAFLKKSSLDHHANYRVWSSGTPWCIKNLTRHLENLPFRHGGNLFLAQQPLVLFLFPSLSSQQARS